MRLHQIFSLHEKISVTRVVTLSAEELGTISSNNLPGIALKITSFCWINSVTLHLLLIDVISCLSTNVSDAKKENVSFCVCM